MPDYDDDTVYEDYEHMRFYKAEYELKAVDLNAAYEVLKAKLSTLYGEGAVQEESYTYANYVSCISMTSVRKTAG